MRTSLPAIAVFGFLATACYAPMASSGSSASRDPQPQPDAQATTQPKGKSLPVGRPVAPLHFTQVTEANWYIANPVVGRVRQCQDGKILTFLCQSVDLLAFLPLDSIGGGDRLNGIWGWTDSATGREFAVVGRTNGTSFVEITDPVNPRYLGQLPLHAGAKPSTWRELKVYKHHAFIVADAAGRHGMQIFDLTQLRTVTTPTVFQETAHYDGIAHAHTIAINEATGFAYLMGSGGGGQTCDGGLHMIDIRDPLKPTFAGCYAETLGSTPGRGGVHDSQCVLYHGPDQRYRGRELCMNAANSAVGIVDVTDKQHPKSVGVGNYPNGGGGGTHQGWLTEDQRYFFLNDEFFPVGTLVFDLSTLDDPILVTQGLPPTGEHNFYVRGHYLYQSNYTRGLRILDIHDPKKPKEAGYFRLPDASSWGNYPFFTNHADVIIFPLDSQGLLIVRHHPTEGT